MTVYLKNIVSAPNTGTNRDSWIASTTYALGDRVFSTGADTNYFSYECTTAGTSGGTQPTWNQTADVTTTDNTITWTARNPTSKANATHRITKAVNAAVTIADRNIHVDSAFSYPSGDADWDGPTLPANFTRITSINWGTDAYQPGATFGAGTTTTTYINGNLGFEGITFTCGSGSSSGSMAINASTNTSNFYFQSFEDCTCKLLATSGGSSIRLGNNTGMYKETVMRNCVFEFGSTSHDFEVYAGRVRFEGMSFTASTQTPAGPLFGWIASGQKGAWIEIDGFDWHNLSASTLTILDADYIGTFILRNGKLNSGGAQTVNLTSATPTRDCEIAIYNVDSGNTNYNIWEAGVFGTVTTEENRVVTGDTNSWAVVTNTAASFPHCIVSTPPMVRWNSTTGSSVTVSVEIAVNSGTALTNQDIWLDVIYLGASGFPTGLNASNRCALRSSASNHSAGSATWSGTWGSGPTTHTLSVAVTPQQAGYIIATVRTGKTNTSGIYVRPVLTIS